MPAYEKIAQDYVVRLPRGEIVDTFQVLAGPYAARGLAVVLGMEDASDDQLQRWSQTLIDGAGNFGWRAEPFEASDAANLEMDAHLDRLKERHCATPNNSALCVMLNADDPIEESQVYANSKIAIGGGINEPRDALSTTLYGLLSNSDHLERVTENNDWDKAFEECVRWVAPMSASSRKAIEYTEMRGCLFPKGDTVMTIQASANRDEDIYQNGEIFDVYREKHPHQAFGTGPHFCMGTYIARDVKWAGFGFHGITTLPVLLQ